MVTLRETRTAIGMQLRFAFTSLIRTTEQTGENYRNVWGRANSETEFYGKIRRTTIPLKPQSPSTPTE